MPSFGLVTQDAHYHMAPLPYNTFLLISYLTEIVLLNSSDRKLNSPFSFVIQTGEKKKRFISGI